MKTPFISLEKNGEYYYENGKKRGKNVKYRRREPPPPPPSSSIERTEPFSSSSSSTKKVNKEWIECIFDESATSGNLIRHSKKITNSTTTINHSSYSVAYCMLHSSTKTWNIKFIIIILHFLVVDVVLHSQQQQQQEEQESQQQTNEDIANVKRERKVKRKIKQRMWLFVNVIWMYEWRLSFCFFSLYFFSTGRHTIFGLLIVNFWWLVVVEQYQISSTTIEILYVCIWFDIDNNKRY